MNIASHAVLDIRQDDLSSGASQGAPRSPLERRAPELATGPCSSRSTGSGLKQPNVTVWTAWDGDTINGNQGGGGA